MAIKKQTKKREKKYTPKKNELVRIDIGCGSNKKEGFIGIDQYKMPGVDIVLSLGKDKLPFADNSVDEVFCSHTLEHLTNFEGKWERTHLFNELYRVMKVGATAQFIFPHWNSQRYYGDPTHKEPFSEMGFFYLSRDWRLGNPSANVGANAPHADIKWNKHGYSCDFKLGDVTWGYSLREDLNSRNQEYVQTALQTQKEAAQDIIATLVKR